MMKGRKLKFRFKLQATCVVSINGFEDKVRIFGRLSKREERLINLGGKHKSTSGSSFSSILCHKLSPEYTDQNLFELCLVYDSCGAVPLECPVQVFHLQMSI